MSEPYVQASEYRKLQAELARLREVDDKLIHLRELYDSERRLYTEAEAELDRLRKFVSENYSKKYLTAVNMQHGFVQVHLDGKWRPIDEVIDEARRRAQRLQLYQDLSGLSEDELLNECQQLQRLCDEAREAARRAIEERDEARNLCRNWAQSFGCAAESDYDMYPWLEEE